MAATRRGRARLDLVASINEGIEEKEASIIAENDEIANLTKNDMDYATNQAKEIEKEVENDNKTLEVADIPVVKDSQEETSPEVKSGRDIEKEPKKAKKESQKERKEKKNSATSTIFKSLAKSDPGVQRSVYFERDVYDYIQSISEEYNVKFSNVVNLLLKTVMNEE